MRRTLFWIALPVLLGLAGGFAFLVFLLATETGLQRLFPLLSRYVPGEMTVKELRGRFIGPLSIKGLQYRTGGFSLSIESLFLDWMPYFLTSGELYITRLTAEGITYVGAGEEKPPPAPKRIRLPDIRMPLAFTLQDVGLKRIAVYRTREDAPFIVNEAFLQVSSGWNTLHIHELRAKGPLFAVRLIGKLRPRGDYPLGFQVNWLVRPEGYPEVQGGGEVTGSLIRLEVSQQVTAPVAMGIEAVISDALSDLSWKADLEVQRFVPREIKDAWPALHLSGRVQAAGTLSSFSAGAALAADRTGWGAVDSTFRLQYHGRRWTVEDLRLAARGSPLRVQARGEYHAEPGGRGRIAASGRWTGLSWPLREGAALFSSPVGSFSVGGSTEGYTARLAFALTGRNMPASRWSVFAHGDLTSLTARSLRGQLLNGEIAGRGRIQWKPELQWTASLSGRGLDPGEVWTEWPGKIAFEAAVSGSHAKGMTRSSVQVSRAAGTLRGYPFRAVLRAAMEGNTYRLTTFDAVSGSTHITVSGAVSDTWGLAGRIRSPELESLLPDAKGSLSGNFALTGPRGAPRIAATVSGRNITLRNFVVSGVSSLKAEAKLDLQDSSYSRLVLSATALRVRGRVIPALDLQGAGRLSGHEVRVSLRGPEESLQLEAKGAYHEKRWEGTLIASSLHSRELGIWALEKPGPLLVDGTAGRIKAGQWCWSNRSSRLCAEVDWNDAGKSHGSILAAQIPWTLLQPLLPPEIKIAGIVNGTAAGAFDGKTLKAEAFLKAAPGSVTYEGEGKRRITVRYKEVFLDARASGDRVRARISAPLVEGGTIQGEANISYLRAGKKLQEGSSATLTAERIPFALLLSLLPADLPGDPDITGTFNSRVEASYREEGISARFNLNAPPGSLSYSLAEKGRGTLSYREIALEARLDKKGLSARLAVPLAEGGRIRGDFEMPGFAAPSPPLRQKPLKGHFSVHFPRLDFVPLVFKEIREVKGSFSADVQLAGTLEVPLIIGRAAIENASASVPRLGIRLDDIRLAAFDTGTGRTQLEGRIRSGPGALTLTGEAGLRPEEGRPVLLRIEGEAFEAVNIPEARVLASPDIEVRIQGNRVDAEGVVRIPQASIKLRDISGAVPVSPDVIVVDGGEREKKEEKVKIYSRIRIVLGDKVFFDGFGLVGRVTGNVLATDVPDRLTTGSGELQVVEGRYRAYGQTLRIDRGRFIFAGGPINNPNLDVRAVRAVGDVTAGVLAQGGLKNPRLTLFSTPSMDQANILSYLVLGRPLQSATGEEGRLLYRAASSLSFTGGEFLARRIGGAFGIRDVRIEQGEEFREAALVVGTFLSPRIYVSYGIGLFEPVNRVRIRYELSKRLLLQVESGLESGADLFYKIEK